MGKADIAFKERPEEQKPKAETLAAINEEIALLEAQERLEKIKGVREEKEEALQVRADELAAREERLREWENQLNEKATLSSLGIGRREKELEKAWATLEATKEKIVAELGQSAEVLAGHINYSRRSNTRDYDTRIPYEQIQELIDSLEVVKKWREVKRDAT